MVACSDGPSNRPTAPPVTAASATGPDSTSTTTAPTTFTRRTSDRWLSQAALWGSLASILVGAAIYGLAQNTASYTNAFRGKQLALAGAMGAILAGIGIAPTAVNMLFQMYGGT